MSTIPILLADEATDAVMASWHVSDPALRERLLIFSAIALIVLLILIWAVFIRKARRRGGEHHHSHHHSSKSAEAAKSAAGNGVPPPPEKHRRRRRSGHSYRSRNPTLAETGGLPPIRKETPPESQP